MGLKQLGRTILQPQEVEVYFIIPALRKALAVTMKEQGLEQKEIAKRLGVTAAAVSQYIHGKRALDVTFGKEMLGKIKASSLLITDSLSLMRETQKLLQAAYQDKILCKIHEKLGGAPKGCEVCFV